MSKGVYIPDYKIDPMFREFAIKYGILEKKLTPGDIANLVSEYEAFKNAEFNALKTDIQAKFRELKYIPETKKKTVQLTMAQNVAAYNFKQYQFLQDTILVDFCIPIYNSLTKTINNEDLLTPGDMGNAYLVLANKRQENVIDEEPLCDYFRDAAYWEGKGKFNLTTVDWTTSAIVFPNNTIPNANIGKVIQPVITYIDMKSYPDFFEKLK